MIRWVGETRGGRVVGSLPELPSYISGFGVLGLLAWLVFRTMNHSFYDRQWYQGQLKEVQDAHDKEIKDLRQQHRDEIRELREQTEKATAELKQRVVEMQSHVTGLQSEIEDARRARWAAEDAASRWRRAAVTAGVPDDHLG